MFWLATGSCNRGELAKGREVTATLLGLAEARNDRPMLINAIRGLGMILLFMGHVVDARELTERAIEAFGASSETEKLAARAAGQDAGAAGLAHISLGPPVLPPRRPGHPRSARPPPSPAGGGHPHTPAQPCFFSKTFFAIRPAAG